MPKKRNQKLYRLFKGGQFRAEGGFGCVFDYDDLTNIPAEKISFHTKSNVVKNTNNITNSQVNARKLFNRTPAENYVVKIFKSENAYRNEMNELFKLKSNINVNTYNRLFPNFYEFGEIYIDQQVSDKLNGCKKLKGIDKGVIYFIVMKAMKHSLEDFLSKKIVSPSISSFYDNFVNLLDRMNILHEKGFVHCDLKPDNILVNDGSFYFTDLGHTKKINEVVKKGTMVRTPSYSISLDKLSSLQQSQIIGKEHTYYDI